MLFSLYRKIQYLSLDIVLGAVILLRFFSTQLEVEISIATYSLLAGSVWLIYTFDHLRDAKQATYGQRARYKFHLSNEKWLKLAMVAVVALCLSSMFQISSDLLLSGGLVAALAVCYLIIHQYLSKWGLKEFYVAVIYTVGVLLAPFTELRSIEWDLTWHLFLLTLSNLILFSWFEREEDIADEFNSIATVLKTSTLEKLILLILAVSITSILLMNISVITGYFFIALVFYSIMFLNQRWSTNHGRYRVVGDGVFLLPILAEWL